MKKIEIFLKLLTVLLLLGIYSITFAQTFEKNGIYYRNFKLNPDTISFHKENSLLQIQKSDSLSLPIIKNDFKVNTLDGNYGCEQRAVETAIDGYGNNASAWIDKRNDKTDIYAQFFNAYGVRRGHNFKVNQEELIGNNSPFIAANKNGLFVITYLTNFSTVVAQRFNSNGELIGGKIIVNTTSGTNTMEPCAAVNNDGSFMVMWASEQGNWHYIVYARIIDASGNPSGPEITVSDVDKNVSSIGQGARLAIDSAGNYCAVWSSYPDGSYSKIYLQIINKNGQLVDGNRLISNPSINSNCYFPVVAAVNDGTFMTAWEADHSYTIGNTTEARIFNVQNQFITPVFTLPDSASGYSLYHIASDKNKIFYLVSGGYGLEKLFKIRSNGDFLDSVSIANGYPPDLNLEYPNDISNIVNNRFSIVYSGYQRGDANVFKRDYDSTATPISGFEKINDDTASAVQKRPITAFNNLGQSIILWEDGRNGRRDLYAQMYDENFNPIKDNTKINDENTETWFLHGVQVKSQSDGTFIIAFDGSEGYSDDEVYLQPISVSGEKIGNNILAKSKIYNTKYNLSMNISGNDELLLCVYNRYGAYVQRFNKNLIPVSYWKNILQYSQQQEFDPIDISIDTALSVFSVWKYYDYSNQTRSNKIYGQFFNEDGNQASARMIIDSTGSFIVAMKCKHDGLKNYLIVYKDEYGTYIKRNYDLNENYKFTNRDLYYGYSPTNINIVDFANRKLFITYNRNNQVMGFYANDNQNSNEFYELYDYPYINYFSDEYNGVNSADIFNGKLIFTYESNRYGGTSSDIWANVKSVENINFNPEHFFKPVASDYLYNNYPNPFNAKTKIIYRLLAVHRVKLTIYDVLGREVKELVDQIQEKGIHEVEFDASNLASGVYFYKLDAFDTTIKKMILLK